MHKCSLRMLYYSLVYPYLQYCVTDCGSIYSSNLKRIILLQMRAVRCINKTAHDAQTDPISMELNIVKFIVILLLNLGKFKYPYHNGLLYLIVLLIASITITHEVITHINHYNTRSSKLCSIPVCWTKIREFSASYYCPKWFNMLSPDIREAYSFLSFQNKLKQYL